MDGALSLNQLKAKASIKTSVYILPTCFFTHPISFATVTSCGK